MSKGLLSGDELEKRILAIADTELGYLVRDAPTGFEIWKGIKDKSMPPSQIYEFLNNLSDYWTEFKRLAVKSELAIYQNSKGSEWKIPFPKHLLEDNYSSHLAISLIAHDLVGKAGAIGDIAKCIKMILERDEPDFSEVFDEDNKVIYTTFYETAKIGLNLIPYMTTGDKRYLLDISADDTTKLLGDMQMEGLDIAIMNHTDVEAIQSDSFWTVRQCLKNARKIVYKTSLDENPGVKDLSKSGIPSPLGDISVKFYREGHFLVASTTNYAEGIRPDKLPLIFGRYTEGGTGLGLEVVKRLVDLREGHTVVTTTRKGGSTFRYDTGFLDRPSKNSITNVGETERIGERGTRFDMYFKMK